MSDRLDRAVQAEMAAHEPGPSPLFDSILDRKRRRDRRRAALTATALVAVGVAFVTSPRGTGVESGTGQVAQDGPTPTVTSAAGGFPCDTMSPTFGNDLVTTTGGAATPDEAADAYLASFTRSGSGSVGQTWTRAETTTSGDLRLDGQTARVNVRQGSDGTWFVVTAQACLLGEDADFTHTRTYTVRPAVNAVLNSRMEQERKGCFNLPDLEAASVQGSSPATYRVTVAVAYSALFERCISAVAGLHVPEIEQQPANEPVAWTGGQVCAVGATQDCRRLTEEQAQALAAVLARAELAPPGTAYCEATSTLYRVSFSHPADRVLLIDVPDRCGPMKRGGQDFLPDRNTLDAVKAAFEAGTEPTSR